MGFSRQEYWSGLPFPSPGDLSNLGIELCLLHWQTYSLLLSHLGNPLEKNDSPEKYSKHLEKINISNLCSFVCFGFKASQHKPCATRSHSAFLTLLQPAMCLVAQLCLTLCDPTDCSPPGSSVHGDSPGKKTGVGCHALLQRIFPTQGSNPGLPHCKQILCHLSHQGSYVTYKKIV